METRNVDHLIRFSDDKMQKIPLFDSAKYFCDLYCLKSGQDQRIHSHAESDKIYFVLRGKGTFHIAGEEKELGAGEIVIEIRDARAGVEARRRRQRFIRLALPDGVSDGLQ